MTVSTADPATARCVLASRSPLRSLLWVLALIAIIWQLPHGRTLLYPLSLLATCAHELGHGLAALLVGASFESFTLHADGSGLAEKNPARSGRTGAEAMDSESPSTEGRN